MGTSVFEIKHLKYYSSEGQIDDVTLSVTPGEIHAIIINNSSEQSLFIKALQEIDNDSNAELFFNGAQLSKKDIPDEKVVIMHQKPHLIKNFSVAENISFSSLNSTRFMPFISWKRVKQNAQNILDLMKFDIDPNIKVFKLSRENKKLVYIASIFNKSPKVIIMHEPMEALSPDNIEKFFYSIRSFVDQGGSVMYITKQWEETLKIADRISILSKGRIIDKLDIDSAKKDPQRLINKIEKYNYKQTEDNTDMEIKTVLDAVIKAAEFLTSEYELKDVLELLAKEVTNVMKADGCEIQLIDGKTVSLIDQFEYKKIEMKHRVTHETNLKIMNENDIFYSNINDPNFSNCFDEAENIKTIISIPAQIRSQITGIIHIYYQHPYVYSKEEYKYLQAFSKHAALAIEDTRLLGRSALLQESHHRIKNNLQSIVTLISLQKSFILNDQNVDIDAVLNNIISRIKSIAAVHDLLSKDELGRSIIDVKKIIETIIAYSNINKNISLHIELENILIPYNKATSVALIVNELISNSQKHAFPDGLTGDLRVVCKKKNDSIHLSVQDNGVGFQKKIQPNSPKTLGLSIVTSIVKGEFRGSIDFPEVQNGALIDIQLPINSIYMH